MSMMIIYGKRERFNYANAIYHITTRCNNAQNLINNEIDFSKYKSTLKKCKKKYGFLLHNYVIMNNHVHLVIKLVSEVNISKIMHSINRWYARWHNEYYNKKGHFWEDRFFGELIKDDFQLLAVIRYADLNPVRANLCKKPTDWKYSGARFYLNGTKDELIDAPEVYLSLGSDAQARQNAYADIFPFNLTNLTRLDKGNKMQTYANTSP